MPARLQHIRILSDGRAGHENQSTGLAIALQRRCGAMVETVKLDPSRSVFHRIRTARSLSQGQSAPDLVIAAGHRTHLPLLLAARKFRARSVVIMKPSMPARWFDLCLIPQHDLAGRRPVPNIISTLGALNRIPEDAPSKGNSGIIMIGGPSAHHLWAEEPLLAAIRAVVLASPELSWSLGNSRRTPDGFLPRVAALGLPLQIVPHESTAPDWLPAQLLAARQAWITADSTSMISEAFTARARTGILPMPAKSADSRVVLAVHEFIRSGLAVPFDTWQSAGWPQLATDSPVIHEAARCANEILTRFFP